MYQKWRFVITVSDDGSSTGVLRKEFTVPGIGDIRKVLSNLSTLPDEVRDVMEYRLSTYSELNGHALGNLILTSLIRETGSLQTSIKYLSKILDVKQKVLPLSEDCLTLMGETTEGDVIEGEEEITKAHRKYKKFFYKEEPHVLPEVFEAIAEADLIKFKIISNNSYNIAIRMYYWRCKARYFLFVNGIRSFYFHYQFLHKLFVLK